MCVATVSIRKPKRNKNERKYETGPLLIYFNLI